MIKRFISYYKPHKRIFIMDMIASLLLSLCSMVYPLITKQMLNDPKIKPLIIWSVILVAVYLIRCGLNYFVAYYGHVMGVNMQAQMRRDVFTHLEKLPITYFDNNKTGNIMSRIVNDLMDVSELAHHGPEDLFISLIMLVGSFIVMGSIYMPLTLIIYALLPFMCFFAYKTQRSMRAAFTESRQEVGKINATLENSIAGIRISKAYNNSAYEFDRFEQDNKGFVRARKRAYKSMGIFHSGMTLCMDILRITMYLAGGIFVATGKIDIIVFTTFSLYITLFMSPIEKLVGFIEQYQNGMTGFKRFIEIIDEKPEEDAPDATDIQAVRGDIEFENVSFGYNEAKTVLSDLSFKLEAGRTLALVGPSGGGKTTICHLIPRFYEVISGRILVDGNDITEIKRESLRKNIGIVSQDVFLFDSTIYDNIAYGNPDATEEEVIKAAKLANLHEFVTGLPDGYNTLVGERGVKLSGGQKQRVSIARVFLKNPPILILDEATSALDNATELMIQQSLEALCAGRTTIVVAHRLTTIKNADEILVINDEGIAERGKHDDLLEKNGIYANLWRGIAKTS